MIRIATLLDRCAAVLFVVALVTLPASATSRTQSIVRYGAGRGPSISTFVTYAGDPGLRSTADFLPVAWRGLAPVRLVIPKIGLEAQILALDPDARGAMQAPQPHGLSDPILRAVYWWDVGAEPGQVGNAVIAGHVNRPDGSSGVFGHLDNLNPGDHVEVITANHRILTFVVTAKAATSAYVRGSNDPNIGRIFGPALTPRLNLITCWGQWDGTQYNQRLVVYTVLIGPSPFPPAFTTLPGQ